MPLDYTQIGRVVKLGLSLSEGIENLKIDFELTYITYEGRRQIFDCPGSPRRVQTMINGLRRRGLLSAERFDAADRTLKGLVDRLSRNPMYMIR